MPFELPITVDPDIFVARTRRKVNGVSYGWDSGRLDEVVAALRAYKANGGSRDRLKNALIHWRTQKRTEFDNRDRVSGGLVTKLCVECGFDEWRNPPSPSVKLLGSLRLDPKAMVAAQASLLPHGVAEELAIAVADPQRTPAVIIIDLYGDDLGAQGLNNSYGSHGRGAGLLRLGDRFRAVRGGMTISERRLSMRMRTKGKTEI